MSTCFTFAQDLEVYKRDILVIDVNTNSLVDPGDTIEYEIVVYNGTGSNLTGVTLSDTLPGGVTTSSVVSVEQKPVATDDNYNVTGNVGINVPAGSGVLVNDNDPDGGVVSVTAFDASSSQGGSVSLSANGAFTYDPPAGFQGSDSFTYTITDDESDTASGTVNLTVTNMIWFLDNQASAGGDGTLLSPFHSTSAHVTNTADQAGDVIFVKQGTGSNVNYRDGFVLLDNQRLLSQQIPLNTANTGINFPPFTRTLPSLAGPADLARNGGPVIQLASGNTVRGFRIQSISGPAITGAAVGALTINSCTIVATIGTGIDLTGGSSMAVSLNALTTALGGAHGVRIQNCSGSFSVAGATTISSATSHGILLNNNPSLDVDFTSIDIDGALRGISIESGVGDFDATSTAIDGNTSDGIFISNSGVSTYSFGDTDIGQTTPAGSQGGINIATGNAGATFSFTDLDIDNRNGTGLLANNSGTITCAALPSILSDNGPAVSIQNTIGHVGGSGAFSFDRLESLNSTTHGIELRNSMSSVSVNTLIVDNNRNLSNQHGVVLDNLTGGVTISNGRVSFTGSAMNSHGILIQNTDNVSISGIAAACVKGGSNATCFDISGVAKSGTSGYHGVQIVNSSGTSIQHARIHSIGPGTGTGFAVNHGIYVNTLSGARSLTVNGCKFENIGTDADSVAVYVDSTVPFSGGLASSLTFTGNTLESVHSPILMPNVNAASLNADWSSNLLRGITHGFALQLSGTAGTLGRCQISINNNDIEDVVGNGITVLLNDDATARLEVIGNTLDAVKTITPSITAIASTAIYVAADRDLMTGPTVDLVCQTNIIMSSNPGFAGLLGWSADGIQLLTKSTAPSSGAFRASLASNTVNQADLDAVNVDIDGGPPLHLTLENNTLNANAFGDGFEINFSGIIPSTATLRLTGNNLTGDYDFEAPGVPQTLNLYCPTSCPATSEAEVAILLNGDGNRSSGGAVATGNVNLTGSGSVGSTSTLPTLPN